MEIKNMINVYVYKVMTKPLNSSNNTLNENSNYDLNNEWVLLVNTCDKRFPVPGLSVYKAPFKYLDNKKSNRAQLIYRFENLIIEPYEKIIIHTGKGINKYDLNERNLYHLYLNRNDFIWCDSKSGCIFLKFRQHNIDYVVWNPFKNKENVYERKSLDIHQLE